MNLTEYLHGDRILYLDGGMGTLLQTQGLTPGELPERWNLTHPEIITAIHQAYFDAGAHIVNINTFGANCLKFGDDELEAIIAAAVRNARAAAAQSVGTQEKWLALDIGPSGKMLAPLGNLAFEDAVEVFARTVRLGVKYGVDLIFIETFNDAYETKAALLAAKENSDLPVFVSNAYGADGKLMTGADPAAMVALLEGMGADAVGVNCSFGPEALAGVVEAYLRVASVPVLFKPNAGLPAIVDGRTVYDVAPEDFAVCVTDLIRKGVRLAGGCCGTTPAYISALISASAGLRAVPVTEKNLSVVSSYTHAVTFGDVPLLIGERINPTGKKRFKEALKAGDMDYILSEGLAQQEKGVHILDVNVGLPGIDERAMLTDAVRALQAVTDLPLQIDTSDTSAMEAALRCVNGKPMINSVNGKQESMDAVFPLAKKYGGLIVALTLDENGIPPSAQERLEIARRILAEAEKYGLKKKDFVFDPLALTVSADQSAARETLRAVRMIREDLGCHTSLGVSNVSFGLPCRDAVNSTFFALALEHGLSAAIMDPYSTDMRKAYHAYLALTGLDENCAGYVAFAASLPQTVPAAPTGAASAVPAPAPGAGASAPADAGQGKTPLFHAVVKGLKDKAGRLAQERLHEVPPMTVVQEEIIPALNEVGAGFERKTVFLPGLLMAAEAAGAAFEAVRAFSRAEAQSGHAAPSPNADCTFVLATVRGDIHDIGKNIVRLLMENYGFDVIDLGRDVPPERIVEETVARHAPLVGLSALMTTTVPAMEETIAALRREAPWARIVVGGAVLNEECAARIGADHYAPDAMDTVRYCERMWAETKHRTL